LIDAAIGSENASFFFADTFTVLSALFIRLSSPDGFQGCPVLKHDRDNFPLLAPVELQRIS